ncbi:MAG: S46 family peptidase [Hyphomonadaceae bacterium]
MHKGKWLAAAAAGIVAAAATARAEEGMWTFEAFPAERMQEAMGWAPDQAWLDRVMRATARLPGCSGASVSASGLLLTNQHCVASCLNLATTPEQNFLANGFMARARAEELRCPGLNVQVLRRIEDVTARINAAAEAATGEPFAAVRDAEIARIENECTRSARRCEVVTLHGGGRYALYDYERYDDVRVAFAPDQRMGQFGGEDANFQFPRFGVDFALVRLYRGDAPATTPNFLPLRPEAPEAGEVVLAAGNPGITSRLSTVAELEFERDVNGPWRAAALAHTRAAFLTYAALGPAQARAANDAREAVENFVKMYEGRRLALVNADGMARVAAEEADLQARVARNVAAQREVGDAWTEIARAQQAYRPFFHAYQYVELRAGERSDLFIWARDLVRDAEERRKPDAERLPRYAEARRQMLEASIAALRPVRQDWEALNLAIWLTQLAQYLPESDPLRARILGGETPEALAARLAGSRLADPEYRMALWRGGAEAIADSDDPMIRFVQSWDAEARALRSRFQEQVEAPTQRAQERIARVRFRAFGESRYPDATFSPRLSYGRIEGWREGELEIGPFTTVGEFFAADHAGYAPSQAWLDARAALDPGAVFNFTSSTDIISGNSGSAVIDREGRIVGVVFDGNMHALGGEYYYDGARNRAVSVSTQLIDATLDVYGMEALAAELGLR